jgi:hypothetical protein
LKEVVGEQGNDVASNGSTGVTLLTELVDEKELVEQQALSQQPLSHQHAQ